MTRFVPGFFVVIGCLMFLGCPFRMVLRLAGGDWNAIFWLAAGAAFSHNFSMASSAEGPTLNGKVGVLVGIAVVLMIAVVNTKKDCEKKGNLI